MIWVGSGRSVVQVWGPQWLNRVDLNGENLIPMEKLCSPVPTPMHEFRRSLSFSEYILSMYLLLHK